MSPLGNIAWRGNTRSHPDCRAADALRKPDIFNTDQGNQFTSADFIGVLKREEIAISTDGRGCWRDNVFFERLWRSVKYEEVVCCERDRLFS